MYKVALEEYRVVAVVWIECAVELLNFDWTGLLVLSLHASYVTASARDVGSAFVLCQSHFWQRNGITGAQIAVCWWSIGLPPLWPKQKGKSQQHWVRLLDELLELLQPECPDSPVHDPVVARQRDCHDVGRLGAAISWRQDFGLGLANRKNARLRRVDDGGKVGHAKHPQVRDGDGAALGTK